MVTFEDGFLARSYVAETSLTWPLLVDDTRETYKNYGMLSASFWDVWGPKTWWVYLEQVMKGERLRKSEGDIYQGAEMFSSIRTESFPCIMLALVRRIVRPLERF